MKFLVISDIHGNVAGVEALTEAAKAADAVLFGGDFARFGAAETGKPALEALVKLHDTVYAVRGNCDEPAFLAELDAADISVEGALTFNGGLTFVGTGGGTRFSGDTPFERDEADIVADLAVARSVTQPAAAGDAATPAVSTNALVVIMHNPPKDTAADALPNGVHVGSAQLRAFIDEVQPLLVVTGHIHESAGCCTVGETTVINPGALLEGKYGWVEVELRDGRWTVTKAELRQL